MLESILRNYSALTVGDVIHMHYADNDFYFDVLEAKPAVSKTRCFTPTTLTIRCDVS